MSSSPDLFVVCKSCGSEVSPYITECPYCGYRLQKRAPKLDKGGVPKPPKRSRTKPSLPRLRPGEIPGIRADRRPWATWLLVLGAILLTLVLNAGGLRIDQVAMGTELGEEPWRAVTTLFAYTHTAYELVTLASVALFGFLLERRHGAIVTLVVFLAAGAAGAAVAVLLAGEPRALGANGAALGLAGAVVLRNLLARRRGEDDEADLLGALAIAVVLVLLPLASPEASPVAGTVGGLVGLAFGAVLARVRA
jgi:membrane associated rhomboid family serine protease